MLQLLALFRQSSFALIRRLKWDWDFQWRGQHSVWLGWALSWYLINLMMSCLGQYTRETTIVRRCVQMTPTCTNTRVNLVSNKAGTRSAFNFSPMTSQGSKLNCTSAKSLTLLFTTNKVPICPWCTQFSWWTLIPLCSQFNVVSHRAGSMPATVERRGIYLMLK